jgi:hypothetical protein
MAMSIVTLIIIAGLALFGVGEFNGQAWLERHDAAKHAED